ncbi:hypothetical protein E4T56_gene10300 [Termitomyces sp. T112]|nr:hypothetical protein E4T56_gene10300 [Termitomyces sp. T112]
MQNIRTVGRTLYDVGKVASYAEKEMQKIFPNGTMFCTNSHCRDDRGLVRSGGIRRKVIKMRTSKAKSETRLMNQPQALAVCTSLLG